MGLKSKISCGIAIIGTLGVLMCAGLGIYKGVSSNKTKEDAFQELQKTEIYQTCYDRDTAKEKEMLNEARREFLIATEKALSGKLSEQEYAKAEDLYELAVATYNHSTKYYTSDEYLQTIMEVAPKEESCVGKYNAAREMRSAGILCGTAAVSSAIVVGWGILGKKKADEIERNL